MKKITFYILLAGCLFGTLLGCTKKSNLDNETLVFNLGTEPPTLDPNLAADTTSSLVIENILDGLTDYDLADPELKIIPKIATSWKISKNGLVYTFYLRDDAFWTDGKKVTAHDFEYSWIRMIDPKTANEYAYFLFDVKNAKEFNEGKIKDKSKVGIKALNDKTFQVTLKKPVAYFLHVSVFPGLMPLRKDVIEKHGNRWTEPENIVTNGPYKLTKWKHDYEIVLKRNEKYYGDKPKIGKIRCLMVVEDSTALSLYQTKKLDIIRNLPALEVPKLKKSKEFRSGSFLGTYYIGFNTKKPPLDNVYVRKALVAAIERKQVTEVLEKGDIPMASLIPKGMLGYNEDIGIKYNPQAAKDWMKKAGYEFKTLSNKKQWVHKKTGQFFPEINLMYNTNEGHKTVTENLQAQWKKNLNIPVSINNQEWKVYIKQLTASHIQPLNTSYNIYRMGWIADYPDPDNFMAIFTSYSENNHTHWKSAKYDALVERAKVILDPKKRKKLYDQAQRLLVEEHTAILPIYIYSHQKMWHSGVKGAFLNPLDSWQLDKIWLDRNNKTAKK